MDASERVENLVLGGGEPGKYIAWELAREGRRTVVVERALIGGSCPNIACLPSKNEIRSAKVADLLRHAQAYGLRTGPVTTDMKGVRQRKREMVDGLVEIHRKRFAANGLEFLLGEGRFVAPRTVEVRLAAGGMRRIEAERVFLDLGTQATVPGIPGLADAAPADPCRGARTRPAARAPDRARRRLCRRGIRAGLPPLRQPGDRGRIRAAAHGSRGSGRRRSGPCDLRGGRHRRGPRRRDAGRRGPLRRPGALRMSARRRASG